MQKERRRSWGRTKHREVTVINQEKIEETLQCLAEEAKKLVEVEVVSHQSTTGVVDLQYPELMDNEALIAALKRIKVPIPVYPDGSPSRERLLYLFKTNVLPRPQRNQQKKKNLHGTIRGDQRRGNQGDQEALMDWSENGNVNAELQRKRQLPTVDATEGISPAKRLSIDPSSSWSQAAVSPVTPSPTSSMGTLNLQDGVVKTTSPVHRVMKLKRPPSVTALVDAVPGLMDSADQISSPDTVKKACREKITWP